MNTSISAGKNKSFLVTLPLSYSYYMGVSCNDATNCVTNLKTDSITELELITRNVNNNESAKPYYAWYVVLGY